CARDGHYGSRNWYFDVW
nr:immunoglobulin heavy chain junction region [Mus musculus]